MPRKFFLAAAAVIPLWSLVVGEASAHGITSGRVDLALPLWLYLYGAGAVVLVSFVIFGAFTGSIPSSARYPRFSLFNYVRVRSFLWGRSLIFSVRLAGVLLLGLVIVAGIFGTGLPEENFAPVFVWVIWWVGMGFLVALLGNLWVLVNPWNTLFVVIEALHYRITSRRGITPLITYPTRFRAWPAFLQFLAFIWLELTYNGATEPIFIGVIALLYTVTTLVGMLLFGRHVWLREGEMFSVYFKLLAKLAPTEILVMDQVVCSTCSDGQRCYQTEQGCVNCYECVEIGGGKGDLILRPFAAGLLRGEQITFGQVMFVILMLSSVTFDGFKVTSRWADVVLSLKQPLSNQLGNEYIAGAETLGILLFLLVFLSLYLGSSYLVRLSGGAGVTYRNVVSALLYSMIPIAFVYNMAHYWTFLFGTGQRIISLVSDPFGVGWNLFGTAYFIPDYRFIDAELVWYSQLIMIIVGHVTAVIIAHMAMVRLISDQRKVLVSQLPILALMVLYTISSLWILSQDIIEGV